jgi:hypothetical protein
VCRGGECCHVGVIPNIRRSLVDEDPIGMDILALGVGRRQISDRILGNFCNDIGCWPEVTCFGGRDADMYVAEGGDGGEVVCIAYEVGARAAGDVD